MSIDLRAVIAQAIADALNDQLDDGYELFGDGVTYESVSVDLGKDGNSVVIDGLGPGFDAYTVEVKTL